MNWVVFAVVLWVLSGFEAGLRPALQLGQTPIAPSFLMVLVAYVSLWARPYQALAASVACGVVLDLMNQVPLASGESTAIIGPWGLGCMLASYTVLNFRAMMFRRNPLSMAFLCVICAALASLVVLAALSVRSFYDEIVLMPASEDLLQRLSIAAYTGALALVLSPLVQALGPLMGFRRPTPGYSSRRGG